MTRGRQKARQEGQFEEEHQGRQGRNCRDTRPRAADRAEDQEVIATDLPMCPLREVFSLLLIVGRSASMAAVQQAEQPIINITGEKAALGPIRRDLLPLYQRWINDFEVTRTLGARLQPMTWEAEEAWYERASRSEGEVLFTIYERATLRPIGNTGLHDLDPCHRTAEFGILIGEKECWGKGYGTEVTRLMLDYGFNGLGLHNIMLTVYSFNERGLRAYARAGFREIGRRREAFRLGGDAYDVVYMDSLAAEFERPVLGQVPESGCRG
jgi:RimJ/RimL family protein N-acetyltransferase